MSYRIETDPPNRGTRIGLCLCDEQWTPIPGTHVLLDGLIQKNKDGDEIIEDCRLFSQGIHLGFAATNREKMVHGLISQDTMSLLSHEWHPQAVKNWTPTGALVWREATVSAELRAWPTDQQVSPDWEYGEPHGGTPLIDYGSFKVGFFHSHVIAESKPLPKHYPCDVATTQPRRTYFGAPYAWRGNTLLFPTEPLIWPRLYGSDRRPHTNHDVVFPCGLVREGDNWTVSYGDDAECWLAHFTTAEIFSVLKPL